MSPDTSIAQHKRPVHDGSVEKSAYTRERAPGLSQPRKRAIAKIRTLACILWHLHSVCRLETLLDHPLRHKPEFLTALLGRRFGLGPILVELGYPPLGEVARLQTLLILFAHHGPHQPRKELPRVGHLHDPGPALGPPRVASLYVAIDSPSGLV
jgi:hypothetical protein